MFLVKPSVKSLDPNLTTWELQGQLIYSGSEEIRVPVKFVTDFASIPKQLQWIRHPIGSYAWACVLHDYLLSQGLSRAYCLRMFREALVAEGVNKIQRIILVGAVASYDLYLKFLKNND